MLAKEKRALIKKVYDEFNRGNYDVIDECFTNDFVIIRHNGETQDREGFKKLLVDMTTGFTDIHRTIDDLIISDDKAALFFTWEGREKQEQPGRAATDTITRVRQIYLVCFEDDKISEYLQYCDPCSLAYKPDTHEEII